MPKILPSLLLAFALLGAHTIHKEKSMQEIRTKADFKSYAGPSDKFSGQVQIQALFGPTKWRNFSGGVVHFAPKARSAWHTHPAGQTLLVTEGEIYTGSAEA
ncbi:conserved hypothetical protein [Helicobacter bizzozeronii CIII-1]|uniref:Cupin domain-containing protein n=1 Tax=Helicobacter bizzozeronii (strain CIII-1) TaxID=1002804 RepID=F8KPD6_HELBC|nr:hypothetical protein HBZC1_16720 [Helicobacter bizzozeronii CIII-1]CCB80665.1 conserved hypothetical protein [Helicobacter bizzozeronii CIII-1]